MSVNSYVLAGDLLAEAHRVLTVDQYRKVLKTVRGLVRESARLPGPDLGPFVTWSPFGTSIEEE